MMRGKGRAEIGGEIVEGRLGKGGRGERKGKGRVGKGEDDWCFGLLLSPDVFSPKLVYKPTKMMHSKGENNL